LYQRLSGQNPSRAKHQEKQEDRDSRIAEIKIFPGNITLHLGDRIHLSGIAYDTDGATVGGVKFTWIAHDEGRNRRGPLSPHGEFNATIPGTFKITAEGASKRDQATITVIDGPRRPKSTDKPVSSSTNAIDSKAIAALKQKLKDATEKLPGLSNALASAEKDLKKAELTKSIAAHELELAKASLTKSGEEVKEATSLLEKSEEKQKQKRAEADSLKERAASAEHIVRALAFSPDNRILASAGEDSAVRTWSAESGLPFEVYRPGGKPIPEVQPMDRLAFPSSKTVLAGSRRRLFQCNLTPVWRLERTIGKPTGDSPLSDRVNAVRFSPDEHLLATGGGEPSRAGEIKIWNVADGKLMRDLPSIHSDTVLSLDFSPDGKLLASGGADKFLRVTSLESGKLLKTFEGHTHHVLGVKWKQDGRTVASAGADALLMPSLYEPSGLTPMRALATIVATLTALTWSYLALARGSFWRLKGFL